MGRKQIFSELPLPSKVEEKGILTLIYKGVFIVVKLLLDIRLNLVKISKGKPIKTKHKEFQGKDRKPVAEKPVDNPVIKNTDEIKVEDNKKDVNVADEKPDDIQASNETQPVETTDQTETVNDQSPNEEQKDQNK